MTRGTMALLIVALAGGLALGVHEYRQICRLDALLAGQRRRLDNATAQLATLRREQVSAQGELVAVNGQVGAAEAEVARNHARLGVHATEIKARLARTQELKRLFDEHSAFAIPELRLLADDDWLALAQQSDWDTEQQLREACARVRASAKGKFSVILADALRKFTAASNGLLPADLFQLQPYFESPADPAMLQRYVLRHSGKVADVPMGEDAIGEKAPVDAAYDFRVGVDARGNNGSSFPWMMMDLRDDLLDAQRRFAAAHGGRKTEEPSELLPLLQTPLARGWLEARMAYSRVHPSKGEPKQPEELLPYAKEPATRAYIEALTDIKRRRTPGR